MASSSSLLVLPEALHVIKYMGSKRAIIGPVAEAISRVTPTKGTIHDAFAGTHSVGYSLRNRYRIFASDIQAYSEPIGQTLLAFPGGGSSADIWETMALAYQSNLDALNGLYTPYLRQEETILDFKLPLTDAQVDEFAQFQYVLPDPIEWFSSTITPPPPP